MIIGFDLGDGQSSVALTSVKDHSRIWVVDFPGDGPAVPTIAAVNTRQEILIGSAALLGGTIRELDSRMKIDPSSVSPTDWRIRKSWLEFFVPTLAAQLLDAKGTALEGAPLYIGHPVSWREKGITNYKHALVEALHDFKFGSLTLVPESRAALLHAYDSGQISSVDVQGSVLVVDVGSSTTDITFLKELVPIEIADLNNLGLREVDLAILETLAPEGSSLREPITNDLPRTRFVEYLCRVAKEHAFGGSTVDLKPETKSFAALLEMWTPVLASTDLSAVLSEQRFWASETWLSRFESLVEHALAKCPIKPRVVIITGGGSNIPAIRHAVASKVGRPVIVDSEPQFAVAKGLASFGAWRQKVDLFRRDVKALVNEPEFDSLLLDSARPLSRDVMEWFYRSVRWSLAEPTWKHWRDGTLTLAREEGFTSYVNQMIKNYIVGPGSEAAYGLQRSFSEKIGEWIDPRIDKICANYGIKRGSVKLGLVVDLVPFSDEVKGFQKFMTEVVEVGYSAGFAIADSVPEGSRERLPVWAEKSITKIFEIACKVPASVTIAGSEADARSMAKIARKQIVDQLNARVSEIEILLALRNSSSG